LLKENPASAESMPNPEEELSSDSPKIHDQELTFTLLKPPTTHGEYAHLQTIKTERVRCSNQRKKKLTNQFKNESCGPAVPDVAIGTTTEICAGT
jgi:hypothetical protein